MKKNVKNGFELTVSFVIVYYGFVWGVPTICGNSRRHLYTVFSVWSSIPRRQYKPGETFVVTLGPFKGKMNRQEIRPWFSVLQGVLSECIRFAFEIQLIEVCISFYCSFNRCKWWIWFEFDFSKQVWGSCVIIKKCVCNWIFSFLNDCVRGA